MTARSMRRAMERKALKAARKAERTAAAAAPRETPSREDIEFYGTDDELTAESPSVTSEAELRANRGTSVQGVCSPLRAIANRANAQLSTGPRSDAGRKKSSLNAVKTGLTGRTVLLPSDDAQAYSDHVRGFVNEWQPVGRAESELVQALADHAWRLDRIRSLEMSIWARGHERLEDELEGPCQVELNTFLNYEKQLRNLHTQESRIRRYREKDTAELRKLQAERRTQEEQAENAQATAPKVCAQAAAASGASERTGRSAPVVRDPKNGFVFATPLATSETQPSEGDSLPENCSRKTAA